MCASILKEERGCTAMNTPMQISTTSTLTGSWKKSELLRQPHKSPRARQRQPRPQWEKVCTATHTPIQISTTSTLTGSWEKQRKVWKNPALLNRSHYRPKTRQRQPRPQRKRLKRNQQQQRRQRRTAQQ